MLIRRKTKPISILIQTAKKIADGDLTDEDIQIKNKDEIGDLSSTLSLMKNNLRELIQQVHTGSNQVAASSNELTASAE
ncbi:HAMP domain-containing protein [Cytobacillus praedii]|uniref:HAMP domain-containing protein n=1 Tax=Cytobacillus praedii TaxID=1742358 RepID=UPI001F60A338|nr:HAMP domain-containing protein [Cytobacillus praedii]